MEKVRPSQTPVKRKTAKMKKSEENWALNDPDPLPKLAQDRSNIDLFIHLNWSERNEIQKLLFNNMHEVASKAVEILTIDRSYVIPEIKNAPIVPPRTQAVIVTSSLGTRDSHVHNEAVIG